MTDKKKNLQVPPVAPGFNNPQNDFEKAIEAAFPVDARKSAEDLDKVREMFPREDDADTDAAAIQEFADTINAAADRQPQEDEEYVDSGMAESDFGQGGAWPPADMGGTDLLAVAEAEEAKARAAEAEVHEKAMEEGINEQLAELTAMWESGDAAEEEVTATPEPAPLPQSEERVVITGPREFVDFLAKHGVDPAQAMEYLIDSFRDTPEGKYEVWKADIYSEGVTEEEINNIIDKSLTHGEYTESFSLEKGRVAFTLTSRPAWADEWRTAELTKAAQAAGPGWSEESANKYVYKLMLATSLTSFSGPSGSFKRQKITPDSMGPRLRVLDNLSAMEYSILLTQLSKFNVKLYLASQKIAIENF